MNRKRIFVTVGTTSFDTLIETMCSEVILKECARLGFSHIVLQIGRGKYMPTPETISLSSEIIKVEYFGFKESLLEDIMVADLVVSHAGAGTCLEVLGANKPLIVVINDQLMGNHQVELAERLARDKYLLFTSPSDLGQTLKDMDLDELRPFESGQPKKFAVFLNRMMGLS